MVRGGVPVGGDEVVLSTRRMSSIGEVDEESLQVTVGAGVTLEALQAHLEPLGLELPIDLGSRSQATVGGMAATNAGGSRAFRHGTMRRQVVGVEAVLADGSIVERLGGVMKDATGYDWPSLLVGSEGTLALITRLRLRLRRVERSRAAALVPVDSLAAGLALAVALRDRPVGLEAAEFLMPGALRLVREELELPSPFRGDEGTAVDADRVDGPKRPDIEGFSAHQRGGSESPPADAAADAAAERPLLLFESRAAAGAFDLLAEALAERPEAADAVLAEGGETAGLWRYREGLGEALARHEVVKLDVALPLAAARRGARRAWSARRSTAGGPEIRPYLFGHLLDGNVHVNIGEVDPDRRARGRTRRPRDRPRPRRQHRRRARDRPCQGRLARRRPLARRHRRDALAEGRPRPRRPARPRRPPRTTRLMGRKLASLSSFRPVNLEPRLRGGVVF